MVNKRIGLIFCLMLGVFLINFVSAADQCKIDTLANCGATGWVTIFKMANSSNSHLSISSASNSYPYAFCCNIAGLSISFGTPCSGNSLVKVSAGSNGHAGLPTSSYSVSICDTSSTLSVVNCSGAGAIQGFSLSNTTNAHVGGYSDYSTKVCFSRTSKPVLYWSGDGNNVITTIDYKSTDGVYLIAENTGLADGPVNFEIYERDTLLDDKIRTSSDGNAIVGMVSGGKATGIWEITATDLSKTPSDYDNFYFNIDDVSGESEELSITGANPCSLSSANWDSSVGYKGVPITMNAFGTCTNGNGIEFEVKRTSDDSVVETIEGTISGNKASVDFTPSDVGSYYFTAYSTSSSEDSGDLNVEVYNCVEKAVNICSGYLDSSSCNSDVCGVASDSLPLEINCSEVDCSCFWESSSNECGGNWAEPCIGSECDGLNLIGSCFYNENSEDNCDDGLLTYSWDAIWTWDPLNTEHYDPNSKESKCIDGSNQIVCPAQAQLPFFTWYNALIALVIIAIIYFALVKKKKSSKKIEKVSKKVKNKKRK